jgi:hypothetical protein
VKPGEVTEEEVERLYQRNEGWFRDVHQRRAGACASGNGCATSIARSTDNGRPSRF